MSRRADLVPNGTAHHAGARSLAWLLRLALAWLVLADPAGAQIAYRSAGSAGAVAAPSSLTINRPTGTVSGDLMVASVTIRPSGATIGTPSGWTLLRTTINTADVSMRLATFYRFATGSEPASYTWTFGGTSHTGATGGIVSFSGVASSPVNVEGGNTTALSFTHAANSITTTVANTMLVSSHAFTSSTGNWTPPTGMTEVVDTTSEARPSITGMALEMNYQLRAATGATGARSASASSTGTDSGVGAAHLMALTPGSGPNHYELSLATSSLTCLPTTVTVTACTNSSSPCTSPATTLAGQTATLATSAGTLGATTVTFNASGVATTSLSHPSAANGTSVTVTLSGESSTASQPRQCCPNGSSCAVANSCSTTFNTAGFIVAATSGGAATTLPAQTAGTASANYVLRAVRSSSTTQACEAALSGAQTVNWAYECNNPLTCSGSNLLSVNGGTPTTIQRNNNGSVSASTAVPMTFDANGNAPFSFTFNDVGQTTFWISKTVNGAPLTGNSNAFVTRPARFAISALQQTAAPNLANPGAADASGARFVRAGESFSATVTAQTSGGATTPNFGRETTPEGVVLTPALVEPSGGTSGTLANGSIAGGSFSAGVATLTNLAYSEVGIITLTPAVADGNYLGAGNVSGTTSGNVGRFFPARFVLSGATVTNRAALACTPASTFTYLGENFQLGFTLTAQNTGGSTTANYSGAFAKLDPTVAAGWNLAGRDGSTLFNTGGGRLSLGTASGSWTSGSAAVTLSAAALRASAPDGPFNAAFGIAPTDSDGVAMGSFDMASSASGPNDRSTVGTLALRFGRLALLNAIGAADRALALPALAQYWNGSAFADNTPDSCTTVPAAAVSFGNLRRTLTTADTAVASPITITGGRGSLRLAAPGGGRSGSVDVALSLGTSATDVSCLQPWTPGAGDAATAGASLAYLRGAWCSSSYDKDPSARATFGQQRGHEALLYRRENY